MARHVARVRVDEARYYSNPHEAYQLACVELVDAVLNGAGAVPEQLTIKLQHVSDGVNMIAVGYKR